MFRNNILKVVFCRKDDRYLNEIATLALELTDIIKDDGRHFKTENYQRYM